MAVGLGAAVGVGCTDTAPTVGSGALVALAGGVAVAAVPQATANTKSSGTIARDDIWDGFDPTRKTRMLFPLPQKSEFLGDKSAGQCHFSVIV
jgi:hypothetical protein